MSGRHLARLAWGLGGTVVGLGLVAVALGAGSDEGWFQLVLDLVGLGVVGLVGALIAARLPANPYGWLWLAVGSGYGGLGVLRAIRDGPRSHPWGLSVLEGVLFLGVLVLLALAFLLFPTGRLPSPRWRWLPRAAVAIAVITVVALLLVPGEGDAPGPWVARGAVGDVLEQVGEGGVLALFFLVLAGAGSVFARFRRAGPLERQQLMWFALAAGLNGVVILLDLIGRDGSNPLWALLDTLALISIPAAVGVALLRYRLYDIDRIVSRTVSWGLLTAVVVVLYLGLVAVLRPLLEPLTGSSALAVAGSTLAVAAVFNPARRRLQAVVDRRFDRARYDAVRAVDAFTTRLRDQVDLDEIVRGLRDTVAATVAPTRIAVWIRDVPAAREV